MIEWIKKLLSDDDTVSSSRFMALGTWAYVIVFGTYIIIVKLFTPDIGWYLVSLLGVVVLNKGASKFKEKPNYRPNNKYGGRSYDDESG